MKTIGLTGGIATGKSTVARILREDLNLPVIDADAVSRDVTARGTPGLAWIVESFGSDVLDDDGSLDRLALRNIVQADRNRRKTLEAITHPLISQEIEDRLTALENTGAAVAVVEAALMVETGSHQRYDHLIVVLADPETQLSRLMERSGLSDADARQWVANQMSPSEKAALATVVVHNDGTVDELRRAVLDAWGQIEF
ncbi:MAG TPA: dephospho-CoA kinase [Myxococcota bacterium]|nr:dephospho-CoA kinase [Myxococcota bacterium]